MDYGNDNGNGYQSRSFGNRNERGGDGGDGGGRYRQLSERSVIQIPGSHIGKIIGPAGKSINEMQRQFNVKIQINKMANSDGSKDAEIQGNSVHDIQDAIKAINEQINTPLERRGGGEGGSRFGGGGGGSFGGQRNNYSSRNGDRSGYRRDEN